jgi:ribonuclease-3
VSEKEEEYQDVVRQLELVVEHTFQNPKLAIEAITHSSAKDRDLPCNERLEFLGDSILGEVISEYLFHRFPQNEEGDLSTMKSILVSSKTLAACAADIGIDKMIILGRGLTEKKALPRSILCNAFEAVIAALYLDGGVDLARSFVLNHIGKEVEEIIHDRHEKNYKSLLQDYAQRNLSMIPNYRVVQEKGPDHKKMFEVMVELDVKEFGSAWGPNKKDAEQKAAQQALIDLGVLEGPEPEEEVIDRESDQPATN